MSNTKYTDPTNATDPPGGKHHDTRETDGEANRVPSEEAGDKAKAGGKTATSPKTVAETEK